MFPYSGFIVNPTDKSDYATNLVFAFYAMWFFLAIFIIWLFVFVSMSVPDEEAALHLNWMGRRFGNLPQSPKTWKNSLAWNCTVVIVLASLVVFDIVMHHMLLHV